MAARSASVRQDQGDARPATALEVSPYVSRKVAAIRAHRTQFPIALDLLPESILQRLLGREYFERVSPPQISEAVLPFTADDDMEQGQAA